jgi:hypothetical protein
MSYPYKQSFLTNSRGNLSFSVTEPYLTIPTQCNLANRETCTFTPAMMSSSEGSSTHTPVYQNLRHEVEEIRLIRMEPLNQDSEKIECSIKTFQLATALFYDALSYMWEISISLKENHYQQPSNYGNRKLVGCFGRIPDAAEVRQIIMD